MRNLVLLCLMAAAPLAFAQAPAQAPKNKAQPAVAAPGETTRRGPDLQVTVGKSVLMRVQSPIERVSVGNPAIADVTVINPHEVYVLGKDIGNTNVIAWSKGAPTTITDVNVVAEPRQLEEEIARLLPGETGVRVYMTAGSVVLTGTVEDSERVQQAVEIAQAWVRRLTRGLVMPISSGSPGGTSITVGETRSVQQLANVAGPSVINMLKVRAAMQVMLEVKVAEISKRLLSRLGFTTHFNGVSRGTTIDLLSRSNFLNQLLGAASLSKPGGDLISIDAQRDDGLIKLLAEPNIMAISGQEASFRAGGKIFIPVGRQNNLTGGTAITLEEKEFGVGLKFKPTVLSGGRINLQVAPEVSELQQQGTPFTSVDGTTSVFPSFTLRRAETTVQLGDGESFMIAGLIQNNASTTINRFPGLGDIPIIGALFRSTEFQTDKSELMFLITPRLVKPLPPDTRIPTDNYQPPSLPELHLNGQIERINP